MKTTEAAGPASGYRPCPSGRHWGPEGGAGCLVWAMAPGGPYVLLSLRSRHVQQGGTWSTPGGAIDPGETPLEAASRELAEEIAGERLIGSLRAGTVTAQYAAPCPAGCGWVYTTVVVQIALAGGALPRVRVAADPQNAWETWAVRWVAADRVAAMRLHPGLKAVWPELRRQIAGMP